jgi:hypothetical protein
VAALGSVHFLQWCGRIGNKGRRIAADIAVFADNFSIRMGKRQ